MVDNVKSQRFVPRQRIRKSAEFYKIKDRGQKYSSKHIVCQFLYEFEGNLPFLPKLGMIVSKKVGNAVVRNRLRRCIREIFRCHAWSQPYSTASEEGGLPHFASSSSPLIAAGVEPALHTSQIAIKTTLSIVVIAKPNAKDIDFFTLKTELQGLFHKISMHKG